MPLFSQPHLLCCSEHVIQDYLMALNVLGIKREGLLGLCPRILQRGPRPPTVCPHSSNTCEVPGLLRYDTCQN